MKTVFNCSANELLCSMNILFVLIGISISIAIVFLILFLWAVKSGQYEDDYTPSVRMLFEENKPKEIKK